MASPHIGEPKPSNKHRINHLKKILTIVGARPNFMKAAALHRAFSMYPDVVSKIVHTGQHYDAAMSDVFFEELELPAPDEFLGIHDTSPNRLIARILLALEPVLEREKPDLVVVIGDVYSTLAAALCAKQMNIPLAHVEAGLRSFDADMPEERNRILTDALSDVLFVTEPQGMENIRREGLQDKEVHLVGNCLIDSLLHFQEKAAQTRFSETLPWPEKAYALLTFHRPANVDHPGTLHRLVELIERTTNHFPAVFPLHPRTRQRLKEAGLLERLQRNQRLLLPDPVGYLPFLNLLEHAAVVVTDSGGVQVESSWMDVPCITLRTSAESSLCIEQGTNVLLPVLDADALERLLQDVQAGVWRKSNLSAWWDGRTAERIALAVARHL